MFKFTKPIFTILCLFLVTQAPYASSQSALPEISIDCTPSSIPIDVYPGAIGTGMTFCTLTNNSVHMLEVDIFVESGILLATAPGSITVQGGTSVDFEVMVKAEIGQPEGVHQINIEAVVNTVNGIDSPTEEKAASSVIAQIKQFSRLEISADQPLFDINSGETKELTYTVTNTGNAMDRINFAISWYNRGILEEIGFVMVLNMVAQEINAGTSGVFVVSITAPYKGDTVAEGLVWEQNKDDLYDLIVQLEVTATSDYSIRSEGIPNSVTAITAMTVTDPTTESFFESSSTMIYIGAGSISVILLVILIVVLINRKSQANTPKPRATLPKQSISNAIVDEDLESSITEPKDEFDFL
ncbi:MAG: choice-of-anchor T family protein [Candidatus Poseidoniaceae archaeon]